MMARRESVLPKSFVRVVITMVSLAVWVVVIVVVGAAPAAEPSTAAARGEDCECLRPLSDVIWGFLITLLACTVAVWGTRKYTMSKTGEKVSVLFIAAFSPVYGLWAFIFQSIRSGVLIWRYNKLCQNLSQHLPSRDWYGQLKMLWSWVSPFSKSQGRILFSCAVVAYLPKESYLLRQNWLWVDDSVEDESEAMVIGRVADGKTQNDHYERKELSYLGTATFMLAEVVPKYDELKFLRGNSGFAVIALAIQALGYIYAVVFRVVKDLPVAPIEVVGLILNIILLIEASVFIFLNPCHRPLVIYINSWQDEKLFVTMFNVMEAFNSKYEIEKWTYIVPSVVSMCLGGIVVYFSITLSRVSSILVVLPLIIFTVASVIFIFALVYYSTSDTMLYFGALLSIVAYVWAFVVTIVYWKSQHFNARAELLNVSQLIPFIG